MSNPCAPPAGRVQCCTSWRAGNRATKIIDGSRIARNVRSPPASVTHQRGRPGSSIVCRCPPSRLSTWSSGRWTSSPMQATTASPSWMPLRFSFRDDRNMARSRPAPSGAQSRIREVKQTRSPGRITADDPMLRPRVPLWQRGIRGKSTLISKLGAFKCLRARE